MALAFPYTGNSVPAPSFVNVPSTLDDELLYSTHLYIQKGVTLQPGQGVLPLGTFLAQNPATKQYVVSTNPALIVGVLRKTTDTGTTSTAQVWLGNILYAGILKLSAVSAANSGVTLTSVLAAQVNTLAGFFKF